MPCLSLAVPNRDRATQEIHVIPLERLDLARSHGGVECKHHRQSCVLPLRFHGGSLGESKLFIQCHCPADLSVNRQRFDFIREVMPELRAFHNAPQNSEFQVDRLVRNVSGFPIYHVCSYHFARDALQLDWSKH